MPTSVRFLTACLSFSMILACGPASDQTPTDLSGTFWELVQMPGDLPDGLDINLQFEAGRIAGKGVCNRYFSDYTLEGNQISFKAIGATEMMCMEHSDVEVRYFQTLEKAGTLQVEGEKLTISTADGDLVYQSAAAPSES